jgi:hypothetical protein
LGATRLRSDRQWLRKPTGKSQRGAAQQRSAQNAEAKGDEWNV